MQASDMRQEISIGYLTMEKVAMPAMQGLISAWSISTSFVSAQPSRPLVHEVCPARICHKTGFKVHYVITLKSKGAVIEIFKYTMKPRLEETSDCINNRQEDRVREKKSL